MVFSSDVLWHFPNAQQFGFQSSTRKAQFVCFSYVRTVTCDAPFGFRRAIIYYLQESFRTSIVHRIFIIDMQSLSPSRPPHENKCSLFVEVNGERHKSNRPSLFIASYPPALKLWPYQKWHATMSFSCHPFPSSPQYVEAISNKQGELDNYIAEGYKNALSEERRRYCFLVDRQCAVAKNGSAYHGKVRRAAQSFTHLSVGDVEVRWRD